MPCLLMRNNRNDLGERMQFTGCQCLIVVGESGNDWIDTNNSIGMAILLGLE